MHHNGVLVRFFSGGQCVRNRRNSLTECGIASIPRRGLIRKPSATRWVKARRTNRSAEGAEHERTLLGFAHFTENSLSDALFSAFVYPLIASQRVALGFRIKPNSGVCPFSELNQSVLRIGP
jgi:hypothetical protein